MICFARPSTRGSDRHERSNTVTKAVGYGAWPAWNIKQPGVRQWSGKISGGTLMLRGNNVSVDYKLVGATLSGSYSSSSGQQSGTFRKQ